jgi:Leucine-rich repeat (LRR) protein
MEEIYDEFPQSIKINPIFQQLKCSGLEKREGGRRACRQVDLCPPGCGCTESGPNQMVVDCHDRQLREIPQRLPPNTVELRLDQNRINHLENGSFWNLPRLARLDLSKNSISQIHPHAFTGLGQLNSL